jgi:hypothetical protein
VDGTGLYVFSRIRAGLLGENVFREAMRVLLGSSIAVGAGTRENLGPPRLTSRTALHLPAALERARLISIL